jgi:site-specific DNA-methyltransferase (adenine-specific)
MSRRTPAANTLFYGDNLHILRDYIEDGSVDLIYLDPPFNSNASYNVLFKAPDGHDSQAQIEAFDDTWHWNESAERAFDEVMTSGNSDAANMLMAMRSFLRENDMMAYLAMMAVRLIELHRVLKPTGSLYLHCDPVASHYLKILLDAVFGKKNFLNEITWKRRVGMSSAVHSSNKYGVQTDILLFYTNNYEHVFNVQYNKNDPDYVNYVADRFTQIDENGRKFQATSLVNPSLRPNLKYEYKGYKPPPNGWMISKEKMTQWDAEGRIYFPKDPDGRLRRKSYVDELKGMPVQNLWLDIPEINSQAQERLGYPTQKPVALLERIIAASSNEGDLVLDPFCGCGTTVHAAQKLNRRWLGIDVTHLAIGLIKRRLTEAFPSVKFDVVGEPQDVDGARELAAKDKYEFQKWALASLGAQPFKGGRKGGDGGVDGFIYFKPDGRRTEKAIVSVKGGASLTPAMVKDLMVTVDQEGAKMGVFLTLEPPTKGMVAQAASAGFYKPDGDQQWQADFPKIQIITVEQLFQPSNPLRMPFQDTSVFKKAKREETQTQGALDV